MKSKLISLFFVLFSISSFAQNTSDMLENALSSVVTVAVYKTEESYKLFGLHAITRGQNTDIAYEKILNLGGANGSGSGFVISRNGKKYVVTNAHVIELAANSAGSIYVFSISGAKYEVKVIGGDTFYDLAVLEFVNTPGKEITTIDFRKNNTRIGEQVFAIGNPLGKYPYSVSEGIISGKNRVRDIGSTGKFGFLQTTATLIWGNSGGPLVDKDGNVVGINSQIEIVNQDNQSFIQPQINFALESKIAEKIIDDVLSNEGFVKRPYLGLEISQSYLYDNYRNTYEAQDPLPVITGVVPDSPAEKLMKNKVGAYILKVNGNEVRNNDEVLGEFEKSQPGREITLTISNSGKVEDVKFNSKELNPAHLEEIAKFVLGEEEIAKFTNDADGIYIKNPNSYDEFKILSAGISSKNSKQMWMISSLSDLGAVLKLSGMYGVMDVYTIRKNDYQENVSQNRLYFSGDQSKYKLSLWY